MMNFENSVVMGIYFYVSSTKRFPFQIQIICGNYYFSINLTVIKKTIIILTTIIIEINLTNYTIELEPF